MDRQKLIILPKLCNCSGDVSRQWFVYYSCRNPKTGKMVRFRHYDGFTRLTAEGRTEHARQIIEMYSGRLRSGWNPFSDDSCAIYNDNIDYKTVADMYGKRRSGNNTIRVCLSGFLDAVKPGIRYTSYLTYKSKIRIFVLWLEREGVSQNDITTVDNKLIGLFFNYLINDRKLSGVSIRKYTEILTNAFKYLKKVKLILYNPVFDIPACNRVNDEAPRPISRDDIEKFKKEIQKDPELWLAVQLEYYCGMRPGHEIREMKIKDIDLFNGTIYISRQRAKSTKERVVTIPKQLLEQLRNFYNFKSYDREHFVFGKGGHPGPNPIGKNKLGYKFRKIRNRLNMPHEYTFYSWKHTGAVEVDQSKIPVKDLSQHYGHSSISITDIYMKNKKGSLSVAIRDNYPDL